jgi:hypothetical protein
MTNNALLLDAAHVPVAGDPFLGAKLELPPVPELLEVCSSYVTAAAALNARLNALLFDALQLDAPARAALGSKPFMVLKQMKYAGDPSDPGAGKFGAGAHADWGAFTLLATDATPGLEVQMGDAWLPVPQRDGCLIINSGDQVRVRTPWQLKASRTSCALARQLSCAARPLGAHCVPSRAPDCAADQQRLPLCGAPRRHHLQQAAFQHRGVHVLQPGGGDQAARAIRHARNAGAVFEPHHARLLPLQAAGVHGPRGQLRAGGGCSRLMVLRRYAVSLCSLMKR